MTTPSHMKLLNASIRKRDRCIAKKTFRIRSQNGVTQAPYASRVAAQKAADLANQQAPEQGWYVVPESYYE